MCSLSWFVPNGTSSEFFPPEYSLHWDIPIRLLDIQLGYGLPRTRFWCVNSFEPTTLTRSFNVLLGYRVFRPESPMGSRHHTPFEKVHRITRLPLVFKMLVTMLGSVRFPLTFWMDNGNDILKWGIRCRGALMTKAGLQMFEIPTRRDFITLSQSLKPEVCMC